MFNRAYMYVGSFLTPEALDQPALVREHFPLYDYIPRQEVVLEPGDVLLNPQVFPDVLDDIYIYECALITVSVAHGGEFGRRYHRYRHPMEPAAAAALPEQCVLHHAVVINMMWLSCLLTADRCV